MAKEETKQEPKVEQKNKKAESIKIKFIGAALKTTVPDLGEFTRDEAVTFEGEAMKKAALLIKSNKNFKEVR